MAPSKKEVDSSPKATVKKSMDHIVKRPARGFHRFRSGVLNVTPKGREKELVKSNQNSPLLRLPPEIRSQIWGYVVGFQTLKAVWIRKSGTRHRRIIPPVFTGTNLSGLLRCCRQIYAEAALLPYRLNTFTIWDYRRIKYDFNLLKPYQRAQITHIQLEATGLLGVMVGYHANAQNLATSSMHNLAFLPALKQVCVLVFPGVNRDQRRIDAIRNDAKDKLDILLAGRDLKIVFKTHNLTWDEYFSEWKTPQGIPF